METGSSTHHQPTRDPNPVQQPDPEDEDIISRSVNAEQIDRTDEQILPARYHKDIRPNNHFIDFDTYNHSDKLLMEILKGHPLNHALSATATAPNIYVQQLWHSLTFVPEGVQGHFDFQIDNMELTINLHHFRRILHLPRRQQMPNNEFESFAEESDICRELEFLGYRANLPSLWMFKRKHLPGRWNYLFPILLKCLTAQATGFDKANRNFYQLYHAFVFGRNVDFATPIWTELRDHVLAKGKRKDRTYIPFLMFFQLIITRELHYPEVVMGPQEPPINTPAATPERSEEGSEQSDSEAGDEGLGSGDEDDDNDDDAQGGARLVELDVKSFPAPESQKATYSVGSTTCGTSNEQVAVIPAVQSHPPATMTSLNRP